MLVIGHRGAKGLAPENTLESLRAGMEAGADMLEFDVRLTADKVAVLSHNAWKDKRIIRRTTLSELKKAGTVTTLNDVLDEFFGKILLNIQIKPVSDVNVIFRALQKHVDKPEDWDNILVSSFQIRTLSKLRQLSKDINLALLHSVNPFAFVTYDRRLKLSAVGWHRLHVNTLAVTIAKKAGLFTYVYTVNRPKAAVLLVQKGIDGIVTDHPDRLAS